MAKVKINKVRLYPSMSDSEKISELEKNLFALECMLEYILSNLSEENMGVKGV